jgi:hypothetical protein
MEMSDARLSPVTRTWMLVFAAILLPVVAGLLALTLVHDGSPSCDSNAIGPRNGMCRLPTNPSGAPSTVVIVPADVEHHVPARLTIIAGGLLGSAVLFGFIARQTARAQDQSSLRESPRDVSLFPPRGS